MRVVAVVQARMGSTRLPGKVMKDLLGKPVLTRDVNRIRRAKRIDEIATLIRRRATRLPCSPEHAGWNYSRSKYESSQSVSGLENTLLVSLLRGDTPWKTVFTIQ